MFMESDKKSRHNTKTVRRIVICLSVLLIGFLGMQILSRLKKAPPQKGYEERLLRVEAMAVVLEDVPVFITGYGEIQALDTVVISPEVAGRIVDIHPHLELGEVIAKGQVLFRIDSRDYAATYQDACATVSQWDNTITRLEKEYKIDQSRLKTLERNQDLAGEEFERLRLLLEKDQVGTRSRVDAAEQAFNAASDLADQMSRAVEIFPIRIKEAKNSLVAAQARQTIAKLKLERCRVQAPFDGRIKAVTLELDQYVTPGKGVLTLANDTILEIRVPLDSRDAGTWLRFRGSDSVSRTGWFKNLEPVTCSICWTEACDRHDWQGRLDRVVKFDQQTRTVTVAIRIDGEAVLPKDKQVLPLVEGMFCMVRIPGQTLKDVFVLPRWAVNFNNTVYTSVDGRLKTVEVEVARIEGEKAFISSGLNPGDVVITTRLIDPLENTLIEIADN